MKKRGDITKFSHTLLSIIIFFGLITTACSDNPADNDDSSDNPSGEFTIEGTVNGYEFGEQELYQAEDFVDLIEGTIEEDGSFTATFLGIDEIEDALKPIGDSSSDNFVGIYCREEISENVGSDYQFTDVNVFNFTYGDDNNLAMIGLSSGEPNINVYPPQGNNSGAYQVRWIFSSQDISINEECSDPAGGNNHVDLELSEGWNEVIFDVSDSENKQQFTGERPGEVNWVLDQ